MFEYELSHNITIETNEKIDNEKIEIINNFIMWVDPVHMRRARLHGGEDGIMIPGYTLAIERANTQYIQDRIVGDRINVSSGFINIEDLPKLEVGTLNELFEALEYIESGEPLDCSLADSIEDSMLTDYWGGILSYRHLEGQLDAELGDYAHRFASVETMYAALEIGYLETEYDWEGSPYLVRNRCVLFSELLHTLASRDIIPETIVDELIELNG